MPVVDNENRLVGIITVDDIVDIMRKKQLKISKKWPQWYRQTSLILKMARLKHLKEYRGFCY
ncbi:MAG: CBS domain-containing protein [Thomasclavelia ramosa]